MSEKTIWSLIPTLKLSGLFARGLEQTGVEYNKEVGTWLISQMQITLQHKAIQSLLRMIKTGQ